MSRDIEKKLQDLLSLDSPSNYQTVEDACESITDEFEDLTLEEHTDICDTIEIWFHAES